MAKNPKTFFETIKYYLKGNKVALVMLVFLSVFIDVFFLSGSSDFIIFGVLLFFIVLIISFRVKSNLTFIFCIVLLATMYIGFITSGASAITEKSAVWLVLFLLIGIVQKWKE